ncbi:MAG: tetratricopeptide repeat protein [Anaerolineales bacterium]|nr:tetratricopeptide repeat protein [Anaerolineales bacterium]
MKRNAWLLGLAALALAGAACNLQRVLDPSLPTSTLASNPPQEPSATPPPLTPAPTLTLEARIEAADQLYFFGDWEGALAEYERAFRESEDPEWQAAARLGMARVYRQRGEFTRARDALQALSLEYADTPAAARAYYALGQVYQDLNNPLAAAEAYQQYLDASPGLLDSYVHERRGDLFYQAANYPAAIEAYQLAADSPRLGDPLNLQVKIGNMQLTAGDRAAAIVSYQAVFEATGNDYLRADLDLLIGRAYRDLGDTATAYERFQHAVNSYPLAFSSHAALVELVNAGQPVSEFQRGLVNYHAAVTTQAATCGASSQAAVELYILAIAAFDRYLQANPDTTDDSAAYYRALSLRAMGDYPAALQAWDRLINDYAYAANWVDAYRQKARTQWLCQQDYDGAIETLLTFVARTPSQPASAEFLFLAGQIAQNGGRLTRSVEIWPRVANEYPSSSHAYNAIYRAGISAYRLGNFVEAQGLFLRAFQSALSLEEEAQSQFWFGKALQAQDDEDGARSAWTRAAAADPTGYYSERSADLLAGRAPFQPPANFSFDYDVEAERREAEAWLRTAFVLPADTDLSVPGPLLSDPRFQRGTELWKLGEYELARAQFESLRQNLTTDAANSYRLANYLIDLGLYRTGIFAAREVLNMQSMSDAATLTSAPVYFNRLRFGAYYKDLVLAETAKEGLDPLFFYSMMRQESLFEGFVTSSAGAYGLMQIIPATADYLVGLTNWPPNFEYDDLYRPYVSIPLGAHYLAIQTNGYEGDMYAALAAYNAGPGNASYWQGLLDEDDPDLYLEVITFAETHNHIRSIYELYNIYRDLYSTP